VPSYLKRYRGIKVMEGTRNVDFYTFDVADRGLKKEKNEVM
jgi:hypothetical protein